MLWIIHTEMHGSRRSSGESGRAGRDVPSGSLRGEEIPNAARRRVVGGVDGAADHRFIAAERRAG
jgi:hypothetical protein